VKCIARGGRPLDPGKLIGCESAMNTQEVTMHITRPTTTFIAHSKSFKAAGIAISLVLKLPAPLKSIADQVIRSASSVPANLAEGAGRSGRDRNHHWRIAYASAKEVDTHLQILLGTGAVNAKRTHTAPHLFDDVRALTWRLLHR
jgi:four helix bundle protein